MTDTQLFTLCVSVIVPLSMLLYSNSRISDTNTNLNKRMDDLKADLIKHMDNGFEHMEILLRLHESEHHKK